MSYKELYNLVSKPWSNVKEIQKIANCGRDTAIKIRNEIIDEIINSGKQIPNTKIINVPTKNVIDKLNLDVNYIFQMSNLEDEIRTEKYASISK